MVVSESERPEMNFQGRRNVCFSSTNFNLISHFFGGLRYKIPTDPKCGVNASPVTGCQLENAPMASQAARCELRQPRYNDYETPKLVALPSICWLSLWRVYVDCKLISRGARVKFSRRPILKVLLLLRQSKWCKLAGFHVTGGSSYTPRVVSEWKLRSS